MAHILLLKQFPESGPPLVWEMKKGVNYTSPAISGDRLVYLHRVGDKECVECLHPETTQRIFGEEGFEQAALAVAQGGHSLLYHKSDKLVLNIFGVPSDSRPANPCI